MKGIHPNVNPAVTCALLAAGIAFGGCRSSSSGIANNPFLAPDRVAPPSTRVLAPGQAQPYYQGDPLPVMQSGTAPPANAVAATINPADALSSSGRSLAWNTPGGAAPPANAAAPWDNPPPAKIAYANEPAVSVPVDSNALRFALPAPTSPDPTSPIAAAPPQTAPQPIPPVTTPPNQGVMLASYNAPIAGVPSPIASAPTLASVPQQVASPWRAPQLAPSSPPNYGAQPYPIQQLGAQPQQYTIPAVPANSFAPPPGVMPTNPMAVQLRAVPSPPPQPGDPMPRIRVPGYDVPQTATADGFRPRSSMR